MPAAPRQVLTGARFVLVGAPGSGKTTVGRILADELGCPFVDADELIEQSAGMPADDIFAVDGEQRFRELERAAVLQALAVPGAVVAASSGCVLDAGVRKALREHTVAWLEVDATHASRRSGLSAVAPAFFAGMRASLVRQIADRAPRYAEVATFSVDTNRHPVDEVVSACRARLGAAATD